MTKYTLKLTLALCVFACFIAPPTQAAEDDTNGWCSTLNGEHRLFLVAEILLTVVHLRSRVASQAKGKERKAIAEIFGLAIQELQKFTDGVTTEEPLPQNLRDYVNRVQTFAHPTGDETEVQHVR